MSNLVLLHGWGAHSGVWKQSLEYLEPKQSTLTAALDFPGYGSRVEESFPSDLYKLAEDMLDKAPEKAIWGGWSTGGMVAMQAALIAPERVQGLLLVCSTPKFVVDDEWSFGTQIDSFATFVESLDKDYERNLRRFLLLQAGDTKRARALSEPIQQIIDSAPQPSKESLNAGLELLSTADLRTDITRLKIPVRILSGTMDRICHPQASRWMAEKIGASFTEIRCGHGPLLSHASAVAEELKQLLAEAENQC